MLGLLLALFPLVLGTYVVPPANLNEAPYAEWAHYHWVWLSSGDSNQQNVSQLVTDYFAHNITVGAVDIDSGWSTGFNNFIVDTSIFPDMAGLVSELHAKNVNVILWATSMIDTDSSNYEIALNKSFFITNALSEFSTLKWWHGKGGLLDYSNPNALSWWHSQMDSILNLGIDGWKVDGTDPFIMEYLIPHGYKDQTVTYREYADYYYGDFFNYTRQRNGPHCLIWSRPVDSYVLDDVVGAFLPFSPHDVLFSGWVGDQDPTFAGLQDAMTNIIYSAWYNYTNFGSDIGGYRTGGPPPLGRTKELFTRWFEVGAFMPLMENGGDNEHRPWMFDENGTTNTTDTYRLFVNAHYELVPYMLTTGTQAYESNRSSILPRQPFPEDLWLLQIPNITDYSYFLGASILVVPVLAANVTFVQVQIPPGPSSWYNYFQPAQIYQPGAVVNFSCPLSTLPVFGKSGAIMPLNVTTDSVGHGDCSFSGSLVLYVHMPRTDGEVVSQEIREFQGGGMVVNYTVQPSVVSSGTYDVTITSSAHHRSLVFFLQAVQTTQSTLVSLEASPANDLETAALPASAHPQGLLKSVAGTPSGSHPTEHAESDFGSPSWSMADAQDTLSELHELVVRVPAPWGSSGAVVRVANVLLPY